MNIIRRLLVGASALTVALVLACGAASAPSGTFIRIFSSNVGPDPHVSLARTADGTLHLLYATSAAQSGTNGIATATISKFGTVGPQVQALAGWKTAVPGLVSLSGGTLTSFFGAIDPGTAVSGVWSITSTDGGATWSAPSAAGSGSAENLAYASPITAAPSASVPILTLPQAGNLVVQHGIGLGAPTQQVTDGTDGSAVDVDSTVDASTGEVVASWESLDGSGGLWMQGVAPSLESPQLTLGQHRPALVLAGRDSGPGVFAAYTLDGTHVRLARYKGGSVSVGMLPGVSANALGVATGKDGRIWVMWGSENGGLAVTRSNKAVNMFEPIQHLDPKAFTLYRLYGDGRLGPLDLFVDEVPAVKSGPLVGGTFYTRVLPELSVTVSAAAVKNASGQVIAHKLHVTVSDAGDPVVGATVHVGIVQKKTNASGVAVLTVPGSTTGAATVTVTQSGYRPASTSAQLS